ncbi:MAG: sulfurtransferase, partial [Thermomicrobiales bacterium]
VDRDWLDYRPSVLLVDARPADAYARAHLPGAINLDTFFYVNERTDPEGLRKIEADWARMFGAAGITPDDTAVFYDAGTENYAPRGAFMLRYLGHPASHVLHGGIAGWMAAGRAVTTEPPERQPTPGVAYPINAQRAMIATADEVAAALGDLRVVVLDVRASDEYHGKRQMQGNPRLGRLPGVAYVEWTSLLADTKQYKDPAEMRRILTEAGVVPEKEIIIYCQRSHRATNTYTALAHLGYPHVRVYPGSFYEWSRREDLPIEQPDKDQGSQP